MLLMVAMCGLSQAHFIWAEIRETPNRHVAIELAEAPGDSVVPAVNKKSQLVKPVPTSLKYALATNASDFGGPINASDKVVGAAMDYGLLERGEVPFKLFYFAKAVENPADASTRLGLTVELVAKVSGKDLLVTALHKGKPVSGADITVHLPEVEPSTGVTDKAGTYLIAGGADESLAVMARVVEKISGTLEGKKFNETRSYSTLVVGRFSKAQAKPQPAYETLKSAVENRETFPTSLLGVQMEISADVDGKEVTGSFSFDLGTGVSAKLTGDETAKKWVEGQVRSLLLHRSAGRFEDGDGAYELEYTGSQNALGRQIQVNDASKTKYRVKDGQILEVERNMGPTRLLVSVLDSISTSETKKLATLMTVSTFDVATGAIKSSSLITDSFSSVDGIWLPSRRRVVEQNKDGSVVRVIYFKSPKTVVK